MRCLDASALVAFLLGEAGSGIVEHRISLGTIISAANLAEVATVLVRGGSTVAEAAEDLTALPLAVLAVDRQLALDAGALYPVTRPFGLSLGDRLCLALARREGVPVVTADQVWRKAGPLIGIEVELIR